MMMKTTTFRLTILLSCTVVLCGAETLRRTNKAKAPRKLQDDCDPSVYDFPAGHNSFLGDAGLSTYIAMIQNVDNISKRETPIAIRIFNLLESASWNCVSAYSNDMLDAFTRTRPIIEVPPTVCGTDTHITGARAQCMMSVYATAMPVLAADNVPLFQEAVVLLSMDFSTTPPSNTGAYPMPYPIGPDPSMQECVSIADDDAFETCVTTAVEEGYYTPRLVGSALALNMLRLAKDDGFNMDGTANGCQYNCRPYADTTGYVPVNVPGSPGARRQRWAPLLEDDGKGFFYRQEHVTPHIGFTGVPRLLTRDEVNDRSLPTPEYQYKDFTSEVLDRMAQLDDLKKVQIEFFDDKSNVVALFGRALAIRYGPQFAFEHALLFDTAYTAAEYDSILVVWKEKVIHDRVRTTTVIQDGLYRTPDEITTWAGPYQGTQTFSATEFQPYKRVMPHAEYPSGSACICTAEMEAVQSFMKVVFADEIGVNDRTAGFFAPASFAAGSSSVEPGMTPAEDVSLVFFTLQQVRDTCGESRLDGGMHFAPSVPDAYELCSGFGPYVEDYLQVLMNGSAELLRTYVPSAGPPGGRPP